MFWSIWLSNSQFTPCYVRGVQLSILSVHWVHSLFKVAPKQKQKWNQVRKVENLDFLFNCFESQWKSHNVNNGTKLKRINRFITGKFFMLHFMKQGHANHFEQGSCCDSFFFLTISPCQGTRRGVRAVPGESGQLWANALCSKGVGQWGRRTLFS